MPGVERIYLDTNIFIAAFEQEGALAEMTAALISGTMTRSSKSVVTSEMTLAELLVLPFRRSNTALIEFYTGLLSPDGPVDLRPANRDIFLMAANLRSEMPSLKLPDAVHLATAITSDCTHILTADRGIGLSSREGYPIVLRPDELTLTYLIESLSA